MLSALGHSLLGRYFWALHLFLHARFPNNPNGDPHTHQSLHLERLHDREIPFESVSLPLLLQLALTGETLRDVRLVYLAGYPENSH